MHVKAYWGFQFLQNTFEKKKQRAILISKPVCGIHILVFMEEKKTYNVWGSLYSKFRTVYRCMVHSYFGCFSNYEVPQFLRSEKQTCYHSGIDDSEYHTLEAEAQDYSRQFDTALQHHQSCYQHHKHPKNGTTGLHITPKCCLGKHGSDCKHGFPQEASMNRMETTVVCIRMARKRGLATSGKRSAVSTVMTKRNCALVDNSFVICTNRKPMFLESLQMLCECSV